MDFVQRFSGVPAGSLLRRSEVAAPSGGLDWKEHLPHGKISPPAFSQDAQGRAHRRNPAGNLHSAGKLSNFSGRSASGLPHLLLALVCAAYFLGISDSRHAVWQQKAERSTASLQPPTCPVPEHSSHGWSGEIPSRSAKKRSQKHAWKRSPRTLRTA